MNKAGAVKEPPGFLSVFLLKNGIKIQKGQKFFENKKSEKKRDITSIYELEREKYLNFFVLNGFFTVLTKKLLTFADFCTIFYINNSPVPRQRGAA